ncbi:DUF4394 domain-containing protein [Coleofasciculus sp. FACHB-T130]|uniref:DUF4394 domain-containing protein n=1 Tax=Cyanophyceae TaxID=3028117 RepID=UPI00168839CD|nr:DUF4394 domain-containing protein [Coleofasciculus sp. FACHB-T130]MBD1880347.1 DUF4394 domain-containing protein [Coleofasciculus sp. FACHB-T130]
MKLIKLGTAIAALTVATMFDLLGVAKPAEAATMKLIGLNDDNSLVFFNRKLSKISSTVKIAGVDGTVLGIDFRPADGLLYGVTDKNGIYTIDTTTGAATFVKTLSTAFTGGFESGFDFNPVPDRLRLVGSNDQNLRINVDSGAVITDGTLAYAAGDPNFGTNPNITAAAYTNSFTGTTTTALYGIDFALDTLVQQNPPNAGILNTIGSLGVDFGETGGFDIVTTKKGGSIVNNAFAASGSNIYSINLATGAATTLGTFNGGGNIVGLAATSVPEPGTVGSLLGFGALALLSRSRRRVKSAN